MSMTDTSRSWLVIPCCKAAKTARLLWTSRSNKVNMCAVEWYNAWHNRRTKKKPAFGKPFDNMAPSGVKFLPIISTPWLGLTPSVWTIVIKKYCDQVSAMVASANGSF